MPADINKTITVISIDDHPMVREGIALFLSLQNDINVIAQASTIDEGLALIALHKPDVVLMDLQIEDTLAGIEGTQLVKKQSPESEVIILTSYHNDEYILPAFEAGALSYLLKDILPEELSSAVRKAAQKQAVFSPIVANKLLKYASSQKPLNAKVALKMTLSEREHQILKLIATGNNNAEIAEALFIAIKTVKTHVSNILAKLQLRDRTQVAVHAWKSGMM
ncbi:MAG: response regulator transcription factor [Colwellia sp.]|nr:response regulator transcription factor [Colwellia sp.]